MLLDTFFIAIQLENEASNDRILELRTLIVQILLFVNYIFKEEIAINIKTTSLFLVHNRLDVREAFVEIVYATFVVALSLIK